MAMAKCKHVLDLLAVAALVVGVMPFPAAAQDDSSIHPYLSNKFFAAVGLFRPDQNTRLGLEASVEITIPTPNPQQPRLSISTRPSASPAATGHSPPRSVGVLERSGNCVASISV